MKLADAHNYALVESKFIGLISEEGEAPKWSFRYDNYKNDPTPEILLLGQYKHPGTKNALVGGINTNYLDKRQKLQLAKALPEIMKPNNLYHRYWAGRRILPDIFENFYRTYNSDHIRGVKQDVIHPKYPFKKAAGKWIKKVLTDLFKSRKQKEIDSKPKFPKDLEDMGTDLQQTMDKLAQQKPDRPSKEPEDSPEMRKAREHQRELERAKAMRDIERAKSQSLPDDPDIIDQIQQMSSGELEPEQPSMDELDQEKMAQDFDREVESNRQENLELADEEDIEDLQESIVYFDSTKGRYVRELV